VSDRRFEPARGSKRRVPLLVRRATLYRHAAPHGGDGLVESRRPIDNEELGPLQPALDAIVEHSASGLGALAAHALDHQRPFCPSARTPMTTSSEMAVALRSSRTHGAVQNQPYDWLLRQRTGVRGVPVALHLAARSGSPCPCRLPRRTRPRAFGEPGVCWCRRNSSKQSARRRPDADKRAGLDFGGMVIGRSGPAGSARRA
jgi:hypothetical protein